MESESAVLILVCLWLFRHKTEAMKPERYLQMSFECTAVSTQLLQTLLDSQFKKGL